VPDTAGSSGTQKKIIQPWLSRVQVYSRYEYLIPGNISENTSFL
jgi:hypothetical protein